MISFIVISYCFLGFVPSGTNSLSKYVKDVNIHFANKVVSRFSGNSKDRFWVKSFCLIFWKSNTNPIFNIKDILTRYCKKYYLFHPNRNEKPFWNECQCKIVFPLSYISSIYYLLFIAYEALAISFKVISKISVKEQPLVLKLSILLRHSKWLTSDARMILQILIFC